MHAGDAIDAHESAAPPDLAAGDFATWLRDMGRALRGEQDSDVPCGTCTACCRSSQFVHIAPDETDTLAHIPSELLFSAPRMPRGHLLLGYDERGHCPMLVDGACSIYEHRPRTCRTYDCRVFAATGVDPDADKPALVEQVARWHFDFASPSDRDTFAALRAAADRVDDRSSATQRALSAIEIAVGIRADVKVD